jgi:hypothetical protein
MSRGVIGEIVGIVKQPEQGFVLDLGGEGAILIDAKGIAET